MAYLFSTNQYLTASLISNTEPFTLACWFNTNNIINQTLLSIQNPTNAHRSAITLRSVRGQIVLSAETSTSSSVLASSSTTISLNTWYHGCGVFASTSSRTIYVDGVAYTNNSVLSPDYGTSTVGIGAKPYRSSFDPSSGWEQFFSGSLLDFGIWNVALTSEEILSLSKGMCCFKIRPQNLIFYVPAIRNLSDIRQNFIITNNNASTPTNHTRMYF